MAEFIPNYIWKNTYIWESSKTSCSL